jgi:hypothetical protein
MITIYEVIGSFLDTSNFDIFVSRLGLEQTKSDVVRTIGYLDWEIADQFQNVDIN